MRVLRCLIARRPALHENVLWSLVAAMRNRFLALTIDLRSLPAGCGQFPKGFRGVFEEFPKGFRRDSEGIPKGFRGIPSLF